MTSTQHAQWQRSGLAWHLAYPLAALRDRLRAYGYTVYDIGDRGHLDHQPPEDHTPYSETGWPKPTPYGWVTAIDIMPPERPGLPSLQQLGARIIADRLADRPEVAFVKYINWESERNNGGPCFKDAWRPSHVRTNSTDRGHIHISCRSDVMLSTAANDYDPVALIRNPHPVTPEAPMPFIAKDTTTGQYYACDLLHSRPIPPFGVKDALYLAKQMGYGHGVEGAEWGDGGWSRLGWTEAAFGRVDATTSVALSDAQVAAIGNTVADRMGQRLADLEAEIARLRRVEEVQLSPAEEAAVNQP